MFLPLLSILAAFGFAILYRAWIGSTIDGPEILGVSLGAGLSVLLVGMLGISLRKRLGGQNWFAVLRDLILFAGLVAFAALLGFWIGHPKAPTISLLLGQMALVSAASAAVGYGEVLSRYRDRPAALMRTVPALVYVAVNVVAGLTALLLIQTLDTFKDSPHRATYEVLAAGFGAIAFFRSSLFTVRIGTADVGVGPSALLKSLLDTAELIIDREQAAGRSNAAREIMADVDPAKACQALLPMCFGMLEKPYTEAEQKQISLQALSVGKPDPTSALAGLDPRARALILGVLLVRSFGRDVVRQAVRDLGATIK